MDEMDQTAEVIETVETYVTEPQNAFEAVATVTEEAVEQTKHLLHIDELQAYFTWSNVAKLIVSVLTVVLFYLVYRLLKRIINGRAKEKLQPHTTMLINKSVSYIFWVIIVMYILGLFGVNLSAVWGAAGIAGLAIGFAAQTSVSNIISGLFVIGEKAMKVGDYINVGDISGIVDNVGLLSVKVRTLDNQIVRIPNSSVINSNLTNYSSLPLRRLVFDIPVDYDSDMEHALETIQTVPGRCPSVLKEPAPLVFYDGFGDAINMKMAVWFNSPDLIKVKNEVYINIVNACRENDVVIPFTHFDVKILDDKAASKPALKAAKKTVAKKPEAVEEKTDKKVTAVKKPAAKKTAAKKTTVKKVKGKK